MTGVATALPSAAAALMTVEAAIRLPFLEVSATLKAQVRKSVRMIRTESISDHWKERALPAYSAALFSQSLRLLGMILVLVAIYAGVVTGVGTAIFADFSVDAALTGRAEALWATASAMLYLVARRMLAGHV